MACHMSGDIRLVNDFHDEDGVIGRRGGNRTDPRARNLGPPPEPFPGEPRRHGTPADVSVADEEEADTCLFRRVGHCHFSRGFSGLSFYHKWVSRSMMSFAACGTVLR